MTKPYSIGRITQLTGQITKSTPFESEKLSAKLKDLIEEPPKLTKEHRKTLAIVAIAASEEMRSVLDIC